MCVYVRVFVSFVDLCVVGLSVEYVNKCVYLYVNAPFLILISNISRVPGQNGVSQACHVVKIYHSGPKPSISMSYSQDIPLWSETLNI